MTYLKRDGKRLEVYEETLRKSFGIYEAERGRIYGQERRWRGNTFWNKRVSPFYGMLSRHDRGWAHRNWPASHQRPPQARPRGS